MARSTVAVKFTGDTADLKRAIGDIDGKMKGIGGKLAGLGKAAAVGAAGGIVALGALGKSAVDAGSDLNESLSKSNTVFGKSALAIETFADHAAKNLGQSKQQALEAASSFGNMFTQLGIGEAQAAGMSQQMVILASDFASFHNADISDVLEAQQAAFRGEYDAVQRFVPTINAAAVEQKALEQTGKKTTKELTAQEKALAAQALMMEGAGDAVGDFARTSDGLANKQRIMSARLEDVKAKIGQGLIPVVLKVGDLFLDKVLPAFEKVGDVLRPVGEQISAFWNTLSSGFTEDEGTPIEMFALKIREFIPQIQAGVQQVVAIVREHWPEIQAIIQNVAVTIQAVVTGVLSVVQTLWKNFGDNILMFVQRVWPSIQQTISGALEFIRGVVKLVTSLIKGDWAGVWEGIKQIVHGAWNFIVGRVKMALELVRAVLGIGLEIIGSMFKGAWNGIVSWFGGIPGKISGIARRAWEGLKAGLSAVVRWVRRQLDSLLGPLDEIAGKVGGVVGKIGGVVGKIPGFATGVSNFGGGLAVVGEKGPELVNLPRGSDVIPMRSTRSAGSVAGGGNTYNINVNVPASADPAAVGKATVEAIKAYERRSGTAWRAS